MASAVAASAVLPMGRLRAARIASERVHAAEHELISEIRASTRTAAEKRQAIDALMRNRAVLPDSDPRAHFSVTPRTGERGGGNLTGKPAQPHPNDNRETRRGIARQNEAAEILDRAGYRVHQQPGLSPEELSDAGLSPHKEPDLVVEGRIFDVFSPTTDKVHNLHNEIGVKVVKGQANRIVVNLGGSSVTRSKLERHLRENPIPGLREVIAIDQAGRIGHAFP